MTRFVVACVIALVTAWFAMVLLALIFGPIASLFAARHGPAWAVSLVLLAASLLTGLYVGRSYWSSSIKTERKSQGLCPYCGYDLRADISGRCPECGRFIWKTRMW